MSAAGKLDVIQKGAWPFYRTISGVRLYWELEEPKGPKGQDVSAVVAWSVLAPRFHIYAPEPVTS